MKYDITSLLPPPQTLLSSLSPSQAAALLLRRRQIRTDLTEWCIEALASQGMRPARHHMRLLSRLAAVERGEVDRLMVLMPPGSAKSTYTSVLFPAWYLARHPQDSIIAASHTADLAERFGRRVRNMINEHAETLGIHLSPDNQAAGQWGLAEGGEYFAAGVLGPITGRRADLCVRVGTRVHTQAGEIPIETVEVGTPSGHVLSYDQATNRAEFRRVVAVARRTSHEYWRIRTALGRVVEATGDHRFYTARGWCEAQAIVVGDVLLSALPCADEAESGGYRQAGAGGSSHLLQSDVLWAGAHDELLPELWQAGEAGANMLSGMSGGSCQEGQGKASQDRYGEILRTVRQGFHAEVPGQQGGLLWQDVRGQGALDQNARRQQSWLASRYFNSGIRPSLGQGVSPVEAGRDVSGSISLHSVWERGRSTGSPYQPDCSGQSDGQSGDAVSDVSSQTACSRAFSIAHDLVAVVERVCEPTDVIDIQVEQTECFFANDILVHNCLIDDPVKSRQDADSETIRERVWEWWKSDLTTRLKPGARVVLIMTRWHEADLGGMLLDDMAAGGKPWEVLRLPMEAVENDPLGRSIGEPLWPEWFTADMRSEAKRDPRTWSALYQQAPAPDEGTYFSRDWLRPVAKMPPRETLRIYGASDYAVTDDGGDYTAHVIVGIDADSRMWLLDVWRGQTASDVWVETFCDLVLRWKPLGWAEETGQIKAGVGPFLTRRQRERHAYVARTPFPTRGDKSIRAQAIRGRMALDGLYLPVGAPWRPDFEAELLSFPAGKHDDQVDALGLIGQLLDRMVVPAHAPDPDAPIRGALDMTMTEAWKHADPRSREGRGGRI